MLSRRVGVALVLGALLALSFTYAYPLIYRQIEINVWSKVYYGFWFEVSPNLPEGVEVYTIYYKKDLIINVTTNVNDLLIGKLYYRSDYTENPNQVRWLVTIYITAPNVEGTAYLKIEGGYTCYFNVRDSTGNMLYGYGLGCFDYTYNRIVVATVDLTKSGVYKFYITHQYLWSETNPPDYPPWGTFNVYLTVNLATGTSYSATVVVNYEAY